jgi:hypothetical protein
MVTRGQVQAQVDHICDNILKRGDGSLLKQALVQEGFDTALALVTIDDATVETLSYTDAGKVTTIINKGDRGLLRTLSRFAVHRKAAGEDIENGWLTVTESDFNAYRVLGVGATLGAIAITNAGPTATTTSPHAAVIAFTKGIKRDSSAFAVLKDEKLNDDWHRSVEIQARAQGVGNVFDPSYKPSTPEEVALFREQQKYVYAVLEANVRTDRGRAIIRAHESTSDAQAAYAEILAHHRTSTKAQIYSADTLTYLTSTRLGTNDWQGSTESFILHWQNQAHILERLVDPTDKLTNSVLKTLLENAVHPIAELRQVKINATLQQTHTGQALTYQQYFPLLLSAAANYDAHVQAKRGKRQVLMHDSSFMEQYEDQFGYDTEDYDIDMPVDVIQANAMNRARPRTSGGTPIRPGMLRPEVYQALSPADQKAWRQLSESARVSIVAPMGPTVDSTAASPSAATMQAHVHDMTDPDMANSPAATNLPGGDTRPANETSNVLVNAASTGSKLPPGDIRRVMSKTSVRNVSMADFTYTVSSHQVTPTMSLVDRGANGGIGGNDVCVIKPAPHAVDIRGIDGYQINDVNVGTVGGVVETQKGPIIVIFHQYALLGKGPSIHSAAQLEHFRNEVND